MLIAAFCILMAVVFGKLIWASVKAAWGLAQVLLTIVCLPLALIGMVFGGLIKVALVILIIAGVASFLKTN